jgi:hypothetical protein
MHFSEIRINNVVDPQQAEHRRAYLIAAKRLSLKENEAIGRAIRRIRK